MNPINDQTKLPTDSLFGTRTIDPGTPLHAGTVVYRVDEIDPPPDIPGPHTWKVATAIVERASPKQIRLKKPFPGLARVVFTPDAFGCAFFETPLQAIQAFLTERRLEVESISRRKKEAERAIAWAESQEGMSP